MTKVAHILGPMFSLVKRYAFIVTKNCFGYLLGDFLAKPHLVTLQQRPHRTGHFIFAQIDVSPLGMETFFLF
jgi:hypothetical protein